MRQENFQQSTQPDWIDVLDTLKQDILKSINCVQIGEIQEFNAADQTASVQLVIKQVIDVDYQGVERFQDISLLLEVPVLFLGNDTSYLTIPPKAGDTCIVLFNDRDLENWYFNGGQSAPKTYRKHDFTDAMAIVGLKNQQNKIQTFFENGPRLQFNDSNKIEWTDGQITSTTPLLLQEGDFQVNGDSLLNGNAITAKDHTVQENFQVDLESTLKGNVTCEADVTIQQDLTVEGESTFTLTSRSLVNHEVQGNLVIGGDIIPDTGAGGTINLTGNLVQIGSHSATSLSAGNGDSGTFQSQDGKTITVSNGIVTNIS